MFKTDADWKRESMARRRVRARDAGLCVICCKHTPNPGRSVCSSCNIAKTQRTRLRRHREREAAELQDLLAMQERSGDMATTYYLYDDAVRYYQDALKASDSAPGDRERLTEKLAAAYCSNGDHKKAKLWFGRLLTMYQSNPKAAAKTADTLFQIHRQQRLECRGSASLLTFERAVEIATVSGDARLVSYVQLQRVLLLLESRRFNEAAKILHELSDMREDRDPVVRFYYFQAQAYAHGPSARNSDVEKCFKSFEAALQAAKDCTDPLLVTGVSLDYAVMAEELGQTLHAKACYEQALFLAQQYRHPLFIALDRLHYIRLLMRMGQTSAAHSYLRDAVASSLPIPFLKPHGALFGVPLALMVNDQRAVVTYAQPEAIKLAFQLEEPGIIGGVASAFAKLYASREQGQAARSLLHRALEKISDALDNLDILLAIGQYGAFKDIPRARALLRERSSHRTAKQYRAGLYLFEAYVERRNGSLEKAQTAARKATEQFEELRLLGYAEEARSVVPGKSENARSELTDAAPFAHVPTLTAREREVAALILQGYTNRDIANKLFIALHTVEKHMNAIMRRLGVRSRYQVADLLETSRSHK